MKRPMFVLAVSAASSFSAFAHDYGRWLCDSCQIGQAGTPNAVASIPEATAFIYASNDAIMRSGPMANVSTPRWVNGDAITVCDGMYCLRLVYNAMGKWLPPGGTTRDNGRGYRNAAVTKEPNSYRIDDFYLYYTFFQPVPKLKTIVITVGPITPVPAKFGDSFSWGGGTTSTEWSGISGGGGCVEVDSILPDGRRAGDIKVGDVMELGDEKTFTASHGTVTYSEKKSAQGFRVMTASGVSLVCSDTAPIPTEDGLVLAPALKGKRVAIRIDDNGKFIARWDRVIEVSPLGQIDVQHITVGDKCFWAGERAGCYMLHHNLKMIESGGEFRGWDSYWW
jgi:hypothetical protein